MGKKEEKQEKELNQPYPSISFLVYLFLTAYFNMSLYYLYNLPCLLEELIYCRASMQMHSVIFKNYNSDFVFLTTMFYKVLLDH